MTEAAQHDGTSRPLRGITVAEFGTGIAGAYCTKLFADCGASVWRAPSELEATNEAHWADAALDPDAPETAGLYAAYLNAGKHSVRPDQAPPEADLVIIGEDHAGGNCPYTGRIATIALTWFGTDGPLRDVEGSELIVQALAGLLHPVGPVEGPPMYPGPHHATTLAGTSAYVAGMAALLGHAGQSVALEVSVLEAVMALSEYQICLSESLGERVSRLGVNRFKPTCPLSIHACKEGWIGITPITPAQWGALCNMLDLPELGASPELQMTRDRVAHVDRIEAAFDARFATRSADEWDVSAASTKCQWLWCLMRRRFWTIPYSMPGVLLQRSSTAGSTTVSRKRHSGSRKHQRGMIWTGRRHQGHGPHRLAGSL